MGFENGKLVRVSLRAHGGVAEQVNTLHYDLDDAGLDDANDPQLLADFFRDNVLSHWRAMYDNNWTIDPVVVTEEKDPQNENAARQQWQSGAAALGTRLGETSLLALPLCGVATLKTEHVGRRHTGRMFVGGSMGETMIDYNNWNGTQLALWQLFIDAIPRQPDISGGAGPQNANWCVYSRTNRAEDVDPYASKITSAVLHSRVHWLRSRDD